MRQRLAPPHPDCGSFLRAFLDIEPLSLPAGHGVWACASVSLETVAALRDAFRATLRAAGQPLHRSELLAASRNGSGYAETFLLSCLRTDERLCCQDGERFGLVEWKWLLPTSLEDYIYLALRAAGRPRHYLWITEYVNTLVPRGSEASPRDVHSALLDRSDRFVRTREGTYALAEWKAALPHGPHGETRPREPGSRGAAAVTDAVVRRSTVSAAAEGAPASRIGVPS
jgi:hypothetical protein